MTFSSEHKTLLAQKEGEEENGHFWRKITGTNCDDFVYILLYVKKDCSFSFNLVYYDQVRTFRDIVCWTSPVSEKFIDRDYYDLDSIWPDETPMKHREDGKRYYSTVAKTKRTLEKSKWVVLLTFRIEYRR